MYRKYFKRLLDIALSFCGLVVLAIPMAICALIIKLDTKGPVFFCQKPAAVFSLFPQKS